MERKRKSDNDEIDKLKKIISKKENEIFYLNSIIDNVPGDVYWKNKNGVYIGMSARGSESLRKMGFHLENQ